MGQVATIIAQQESWEKVERLKQVRQQARQISGQIVNLAASYKAIRADTDADDKTALDSKLAETIASIKADMDALDPATRAIVDQIVDGVFGPRA